MGIIKVKGNSQISIQPDSVSVNIDLKTKIHEKLEDANSSALQTIIKVKEVCKSKNIDSKKIQEPPLTLR